MLTAYKTIKNGYDYHLHVHIENYIIQDCNHLDEYREVVEENCCNSHKYRGQDIRKQLINDRGSFLWRICLRTEVSVNLLYSL